MAKKISTKKLAGNLLLSITAQIISLSVSFLLNLIVPKFISEYQYSYWQTYVLYVSYVGMVHFGLLDGLVLRYSKYDYEELDKKRIRSQFQILFFYISILTIITTVIALFNCHNNAQIIIILVAFGITTKNIFTYNSFIFQLTNRINKYATITIVQRLSYAVFVVLLLLFGEKSFYWYCIADLIGDIFGSIMSSFFNKGLYFGKSVGIRECFKELKLNISAGIMLLVANLSSMLLIDSAKMIIQWHWDTVTFGKVSFGFSISNLFLSFVTAISIVLFPSMKRMEENQLPMLYKRIRECISHLFFFFMIFYYPGVWILKKWLPNYESSLIYLGILLPIIIFSSKVGLLTNNYLKAYRKEKEMLEINAFSVLLGLVCFGFSAYVLNNLDVLMFSIVFIVMINSILSEIFISKIIKISIVKDIIVETIMTIIFIICARYLVFWQGFFAYGVCFIIYAFIYHEQICLLIKTILIKLKILHDN